MNDSHDRPANPVKETALVQLIVSDSEEDEAEEGIEGSTKKGEKVTHRWNHLGEYKRDEPNANHQENPDTPADKGVAMCVSRVTHDPEVDEFGRNIGIDDADDESWDDDEGEGSLLVGDNAQTAECWSSGILAKVSEADRWWNNEKKGRDTSKDGESLGEVLWLFHLRDEGWEKNLRNPEEGDVQDCVHTCNPSCPSRRKGVRFDFSKSWIVTTIAVQRGIFDTGKDQEK